MKNGNKKAFIKTKFSRISGKELPNEKNDKSHK